MAFLKFARGLVTQPSVTQDSWSEVRTAGTPLPFNGINKKASLHITDYSPDKYLLTHVTIMASVDTEIAPGVKAGGSIESLTPAPCKSAC